MTERDFDALASSRNLLKVSRRDLGYALSLGRSGGTTVAATMIIAHLVGIRIFATGGIGGVHREGETTMDVSADLVELGRTPITVFSSGIKSILDIPKSLEYLETQGVFVATYRGDGQFPAFFTRTSGETVPYNFTEPFDVAHVIKTNREFNLRSGALIAVPIPEADAVNEDEINAAIKSALAEAKTKGVRGKAVTPFLLQHILDVTGGRSLDASEWYNFTLFTTVSQNFESQSLLLFYRIQIV